MKAIVTMNEQGRLTVPSSVRRALGLEGQADLEAEVTDEGLVLRPAVVLRREDAWAYTPEHRAALARAHEDSRSGRVQTLTESDLERLGK